MSQATTTGAAGTTTTGRVRRSRAGATGTVRSQSDRPLRLLATELLAGIGPLLVLMLLWQVVYLTLPENQFLRGPLEAVEFAVSGENVGELAAALLSTFTMLLAGYLIAVLVALTLASVVTASAASSCTPHTSGSSMIWPLNSSSSHSTWAMSSSTRRTLPMSSE